jgi:hypothetical protein
MECDYDISGVHVVWSEAAITKVAVSQSFVEEQQRHFLSLALSFALSFYRLAFQDTHSHIMADRLTQLQDCLDDVSLLSAIITQKDS